MSSTPTGAQRLAAVAAASRAGLTAHDAWQEWGEIPVRLDPDGAAQCTGVSRRLAHECAAAGRLAAASGVPLAQVLDSLSRVEAAREEALLAATTAAAGPRASARVMAWLPGAGMVLAVVVEPRTLGLLLGTGLGWMVLVVAGFLTWAGRRWMAVLTEQAQRGGSL